MEGKEVEPNKLIEILPDILADFMAGGCDCCVVVNFVVTPPCGVEEASLIADACPFVADGGEGEEVGTDGPAD